MDEPTVETIRLDGDTKIRLSTLKRRTGIENWNVLCRWGFCLSLADSAPVRDRSDHVGNAIEMSWKTFAGEDEDIYRLLLIDRCRQEHKPVDRDNLVRMLRQHIVRGVARMAANRSMKSISDFIEPAIYKG